MLTTHLHGVRQGKPDEKMSVKGCGKNYPDPAGAEKLDDGVLVPCGKALDNSLHFKSSLLYNEVSMCVDPRICMFASSCMSRVGSVYLAYALACLGDKYSERERGERFQSSESDISSSNQFIVYDTSQIKSRYLLRVKFNFK
jgi:hypothetical protein